MALRAPSLARVLDALEALYNPPEPPPISDPFQQILWQNVAYLADDARRGAAFAMLREKVGLQPAAILAAPLRVLKQVAAHGILPDVFAKKLRDVARLALDEGELRDRKVLKKFHGIGDPGADKILLISGLEPVLALDSNALRVLVRLGFAEEDRRYAVSYRKAQNAAAAQLPRTRDALLRASLLLRRHGQSLCKRARPDCPACPLRKRCAYALQPRPRN